MTNAKEMYEKAIEAIKGTEAEEMLTKFFNEKITKIEKRKASIEKEIAKKREANEAMKNKILKILLDINKVATVEEIAIKMRVSPQRVTPQLIALMKQGKVTRTAQGKTIYWNAVQ